MILPERFAAAVNFLDVTMLAADVVMNKLPQDHPDAQNFLPRELRLQKMFDLIICDGQVLRTQQLPLYREGQGDNSAIHGYFSTTETGGRQCRFSCTPGELVWGSKDRPGIGLH